MVSVFPLMGVIDYILLLNIKPLLYHKCPTIQKSHPSFGVYVMIYSEDCLRTRSSTIFQEIVIGYIFD